MADMRMMEQDRTLIGEEAALPSGHALPGGPEAAAPALAPDHQLPAHAGPTRVGPVAADPDTARREIGETRARMSETIDQIEERLLVQKERLQHQLDVRGQLRARLTPVREVIERQPLAVFGGMLAAGLVFGYLTGGDDGEEGHARGAARRGVLADEGSRGWRARASRWERRSRDLLRHNLELEEELSALRARLDPDEEADGGGWLDSVLSIFGRGATRSGYVMELEDEDVPGDHYHPSASYDQFAATQRGRDPGDPLQG